MESVGREARAESRIPTVSLITFFKQIPLFSRLSQEELAQLAHQATLCVVGRGEIIFMAGERLPGCYCVLEGQVKLTATSPNGAEKVIELLGPGRSFGEALMFIDRPAPVCAQAIERGATVLCIPKAVIFALIEGSGEFVYRLLAGLSQRLHHLIMDLEAFSLQSSSQRVIGYLLMECGHKASVEGICVVLPASKNVIASRLNLTPETFSRILHHLAQEGLIRVSGRQIELPDPAALKAFAGEL